MLVWKADLKNCIYSINSIFVKKKIIYAHTLGNMPKEILKLAASDW